MISNLTKTPLHILDKLALFATADCVVKGFTNRQVAIMLDISEEAVLEDLRTLSAFEGFEDLLDINPWYIYVKVDGKKRDFVKAFSGYLDKVTTRQLYDFVVQYAKLRKELDKVYGIA